MILLKLLSLSFFLCVCIYKIITLTRAKTAAADRPKTPEEVTLALANMPLTSVADAAIGKVVKLSGKVRAVEDSAVAPLSGTPCLFFHVVVKLPDVNGRLETILDIKQGAELWLEDGSGVAHVRPTGTVDSLPVHARYGRGLGARDRNEDALRKLLSKRGLDPAAGVVALEHLIVEGDEITAAGEAQAHEGGQPAAGGSYRSSGRAIGLAGSKDAPLLLGPKTVKLVTGGGVTKKQRKPKAAPAGPPGA